ncbi:hypothetical protein, conserved [Plasmodium gonderi]|uniref:C-CAP/cofactor C-like domain-containing protein n=1 Tax=Plasmodium gonderi TaxID=77519 RepID=A0A1Y1JME6_PLAGO|nr:hypothetical protein, conserved [Plasmodium gonderi]GAW82768.1 hypothetical protein, conserved [Plasmodium gonderi]
MEAEKNDPLSRGINQERKLFIRKEIFDHAIIYTTNKMDECSLLTYLKNFYEYFKNTKSNFNNDKNMNDNDEIYVTIDTWLSYNEIIKNQDNILWANFNHNICKSLWILLSVTLQTVKKKNNVNKQKTIFNATFKKLYSQEFDKKCEQQVYHNKNQKFEEQQSGQILYTHDGRGENNLDAMHGNVEVYKTETNMNYEKCTVMEKEKNLLNDQEETKKVHGNSNEKDREMKDKDKFHVWREKWLNEEVRIELVMFFIILQFLKIDNVKKKYDKTLSEDSWPSFSCSSRSLVSPSGIGSNIVGNTNPSGSPSNCVCKSNFSDFFHFCGSNYNHFLKTYLVAFLSAADILNSSKLTDIPLYFKNQNFFLLDFIIDTGDHTNVYERYLQKNEPKILYKTKDILTWLLSNLYATEQRDNVVLFKNSSNCNSETGQPCSVLYSTNDSFGESVSNSSNSSCSRNILCSRNSSTDQDLRKGSHYSIENVKNDIIEIKNQQGQTIYITNDKNIVNIINCKECNIFILSKMEYLKIHACVNCYIISLCVEMISTIFNSNNLDIHLVTRSLKIENVIDTNVYVYTETNIIIFGDTRNIQLAPYNILNSKQKACLQKCQITFDKNKCDLFAFPLKCKTNLFHSTNMSLSLKTPSSSITRQGDKHGKNSSSTTSAIIIAEKGNLESATSERNVEGTADRGIGESSLSPRDEKNESPCSKTFDISNLSSSFTDYVYYLLNPSKFFLIEFPNPNCSSKGVEMNTVGNEYEQKCINMSDEQNVHSKNMHSKNMNSKNVHSQNVHSQNMDEYPFPLSGDTKSEENEKYACLYLPEVYKNAVENQDDLILQFLSVMDSIHLTKLQKQKARKILTYKLYTYLKKSKNTSRVLNDLMVQEQERQELFFL